MAIRNYFTNPETPQMADPLAQFAKVQGVRNLISQGEQDRQNLQIGEQRLEQGRAAADRARRVEDDQRKFGEVYLRAKGNPDEVVRLAGESGIHPEIIQGFQKHNAELADKMAQTEAHLLPVKQERLRRAQGLLMEVEQIPPEQLVQAWPQLYAKALEIDPEAKGYLSPMQPPTPAQFQVLNAAVTTQEYQLKKADERRKEAEAAQKATAAGDVHAKAAAELPVTQAVAKRTLADPALLNPGQRVQADTAKATAEAATANRAMTLGEQRRHNLASEAAANRRAGAMESGKGEGRALSEGAVKALEPNKALSDRLGNLLATFEDDFAGNLVGGIENAIGKLGGENVGITTKGQTDFWQNYQDFVNRVRKELFGSALTATEKGEFEKAMVAPSSAPSVIKTNIGRQKEIIDAALNRRADTYKAGGFNGAQIDIYRPVQQAPGGGGQPTGPKKITNDAEFDALPKGADFIGPDGVKRRKP